MRLKNLTSRLEARENVESCFCMSASMRRELASLQEEVDQLWSTNISIL